MRVVIRDLNPQAYLCEYIRDLQPDQELVVECDSANEVRSAQVIAYQTRKTTPRTDGYDYKVSMSIRRKQVVINLIPKP